MRFYGFGNYYLSSLQQGLQSAHVVGELSVKSIHKGSVTKKGKIFFDWAKNHKTMVLLNGGNSQSLEELFQKLKVFEKDGMHLPYVKFHEDEQSLGGALTYVGMIVEQKYYDAAFELRNCSFSDQLSYINKKLDEEKWKKWEVEFISELNQYRLAN